MGRAEVEELWARMRGGAQPAAPLVPAPAAVAGASPPVQSGARPEAEADTLSWATADALAECAGRGATALADASPATRRRELERLRTLVQARSRPARCTHGPRCC
jgi:hypothetical protein